MPDYSLIVRSLSPEKFAEIVGASGRKAKEVYFHRHAIKAPKFGTTLKSRAKNETRTQKLYEILLSEKDEQLCEELLRTWLLTKRAMLSAGLDFLKIPHNNGLTESDDADKIADLDPATIQALIQAVEPVAPNIEVEVWLRYMGARL
jgi:hypothetical protein